LTGRGDGQFHEARPGEIELCAGDMENVLAEEDWRGWVNPGIATHGGRVFAPGQDGVLTAFAD
jgi:hypothetical protein